jgi:hypothetical protein
MGVGRSAEVSLRRWCGFNASILTREWRRRDKALLKDEVDAVSLSCSMGRKRDTAW